MGKNKISVIAKGTQVIEPVLTITHLTRNFEGDPEVRSQTTVGVQTSPDCLAKAFLDFVSLNSVPYTEEELTRMSNIIFKIYQRESNGKKFHK